MAHVLYKTFQLIPRQLLFQQTRFRGKINIQKPRPPFFLRAKMNEFLVPYYKSQIKFQSYEEACIEENSKKKQMKTYDVPHPYQMIIAREFLNWFNKSKMIAFYHQNSVTQEELFDVQVPLKKANMYLKTCGRRTMSLALENTPYAAVKPLFNAPYMMVFSPNTDVRTLTKIMKKCPNLVLMGGILEGKLLHLKDFLKYGQMDLTSSHVSLVQTLQNAAGNNLCQQLIHHQSTLVTRLKQIGTTDETSSNTVDSAVRE